MTILNVNDTGDARIYSQLTKKDILGYTTMNDPRYTDGLRSGILQYRTSLQIY